MTDAACTVACIIFLLDSAGRYDRIPTPGTIWYYRLGRVHVQITATSTQSGVNSKEVQYLTERAVRGWEESGLLTPLWLSDITTT